MVRPNRRREMTGKRVSKSEAMSKEITKSKANREKGLRKIYRASEKLGIISYGLAFIPVKS